MKKHVENIKGAGQLAVPQHAPFFYQMWFRLKRGQAEEQDTHNQHWVIEVAQ